MIATTHGITVEGYVSHDPGDSWTPASTDVEVSGIENVEDDSDVFEALESVGPSTARLALGLVRLGIPLPQSIEDWILVHYYGDLVEALVDSY